MGQQQSLLTRGWAVLQTKGDIGGTMVTTTKLYCVDVLCPSIHPVECEPPPTSLDDLEHRDECVQYPIRSDKQARTTHD